MPTEYIAIAALILVTTFVVFLYLKKLRKKTVEEALSQGVGNRFSQFKVVDGVKIHYVQTGKGPHVVLLHGIGASTFTWRKLTPLLIDSYTVTAIDIPGFGLSDKNPRRSYDLDSQTQLLHDLLESLDIRQAVLVGSSMGGTIALWMAKRWPRSYLNVVALSPPLDPKIIPFNVGRLSHIARPFRHIVNRTLIRYFMSRATHDQSNIDDISIAAYSLPYTDDGASLQTFLKAMQSLKDHRIPDSFADIKSRVLILWGEKDKVIPFSTATRAIQLLPSSFISQHDSSGHHPMEDSPEWVNEQIRTFLKSDD